MDKIDAAAQVMCGGYEAWLEASEQLRDQYRELARRAQEVFHNGKPVPWDEIELTVRVELAKHSGSLTVRRATPMALNVIARSVMEALKRCRYTVVYGPPAKGMSTPAGPPERNG